MKNKTISAAKKDGAQLKVEEYVVDPEKILKYTRGNRVKTKVCGICYLNLFCCVNDMIIYIVYLIGRVIVDFPIDKFLSYALK